MKVLPTKKEENWSFDLPVVHPRVMSSHAPKALVDIWTQLDFRVSSGINVWHALQIYNVINMLPKVVWCNGEQKWTIVCRIIHQTPKRLPNKCFIEKMLHLAMTSHWWWQLTSQRLLAPQGLFLHQLWVANWCCSSMTETVICQCDFVCNTSGNNFFWICSKTLFDFFLIRTFSTLLTIQCFQNTAAQSSWINSKVTCEGFAKTNQFSIGQCQKRSWVLDECQIDQHFFVDFLICFCCQTTLLCNPPLCWTANAPPEWIFGQCQNKIVFIATPQPLRLIIA